MNNTNPLTENMVKVIAEDLEASSYVSQQLANHEFDHIVKMLTLYKKWDERSQSYEQLISKFLANQIPLETNSDLVMEYIIKNPEDLTSSHRNELIENFLQRKDNIDNRLFEQILKLGNLSSKALQALMHKAIRSKDLEKVSILSDLGVNPFEIKIQWKDRYGWQTESNPLIWALHENNYDLFHCLISHSKRELWNTPEAIQPFIKYIYDESMWHTKHDLFKKCLADLLDHDIDLSSIGDAMPTLLHLQMKLSVSGQIDLLERILDAKGAESLINLSDDEYPTILKFALENNQTILAIKVLNLGLSLNEISKATKMLEPQKKGILRKLHEPLH